MKNLILLTAALMLVGCYDSYPAEPMTGSKCVEVCDDMGGCRDVCNTQYYYDDSGNVVYWDAHFGVWIGPQGYWRDRVYYRGFYPGYHYFYHHEYHTYHGNDHGREYRGHGRRR